MYNYTRYKNIMDQKITWRIWKHGCFEAGKDELPSPLSHQDACRSEHLKATGGVLIDKVVDGLRVFQDATVLDGLARQFP